VEDAQQVTDIKWLARGGMRRCHCRNRKSLFDYKGTSSIVCCITVPKAGSLRAG
jgi:hypothetical protein